jgi:hypothetical protein
MLQMPAPTRVTDADPVFSRPNAAAGVDGHPVAGRLLGREHQLVGLDRVLDVDDRGAVLEDAVDRWSSSSLNGWLIAPASTTSTRSSRLNCSPSA